MQKYAMIIIGYSGHALVVADTARQSGYSLIGYMEKEEKSKNPLELDYLGTEDDEKALEMLEENAYFIAIGNNNDREAIHQFLCDRAKHAPEQLRHPRSTVAWRVQIGYGSLICAGAVLQPLTEVGDGVIVNTGAVIEHEGILGDFCHLAPGAVLAGNVIVGKRTFIGANAVVKENIRIGAEATIGAGAVVLDDVPDGVTVVGNPARIVTEEVSS